MPLSPKPAPSELGERGVATAAVPRWLGAGQKLLKAGAYARGKLHVLFLACRHIGHPPGSTLGEVQHHKVGAHMLPEVQSSA